MLERIQETAAFLKGKMHTQPETAIILGTGLGSLAGEITEKYEIRYEEIPNFPISTVEGHSGKLIFGKLGHKDIMAMQGRFHFYEGYSMKEVTFPVRVMRELGIKTLFVSNASGGTNPDFAIGDLMIITDHINYFPEHPLRGKNIPYGPRFPDMSEAYDKELIRKADAIAAERASRFSTVSISVRKVPHSKHLRNTRCSIFWVPMQWACPPCRKSSWQIIAESKCSAYLSLQTWG